MGKSDTVKAALSVPYAQDLDSTLSDGKPTERVWAEVLSINVLANIYSSQTATKVKMVTAARPVITRGVSTINQV